MKTQIITLALMAVTVMGCNTNKKTKTDISKTDLETTKKENELSIENTKWVLSTMAGQNMADREKNGQLIYFSLHPKGNRISGNSGCNNFMGSYELGEANQISIINLGSTRMLCPDAKINEPEILEVFETAVTYRITNNELSLFKTKGKPMATFKKIAMDSDPITEKYWKLILLEDQKVSMAPNQEREIYFTLRNEQNRVAGFAGCNTLSGLYTLENNDRIRFSNMAVTMKACPDVATNESKFLKIFELVDNYTVNGDTLRLNAGQGAPLAIFEAIYLD